MKEIRCEKLIAQSVEIVAPDGEVRISLDASIGEGHACIGLFGKNHTVINVSTNPDGSCAISFQKAGASMAMSLSLSPNGEPHIAINKDGVPKIIV